MAFMTSGPIVAMVLAKENAVQQWRDLIGPTNTSVAKETHPERFAYRFQFLRDYRFSLRIVFEQCMEPMNRRMPYMEVIVLLVLNVKFDFSFLIVRIQKIH